MTVLHLVPHTHWDREWYLPFQTFRLKLVHLMDLLLDILERDPTFTHFTLDGQTILLEDYLEVRPEQEAQLVRLVREGRLLIGPWYVLPDEFLVSPEALVRNLLRGAAICARFGRRMDVGYVPDPFGHIGQLPQVLRGFGLESAAFRRGLDDHPCELWWQAPDGSQVLTAYLRDGYDNAARMPTSLQAFTRFVAEHRDSLLPHSAVSHALLLNGADHQEPQPEISALSAAASLPGETLVLSTLPDYLAAVRREIDERRVTLPVFRGEARSPKRHHLLAAVLSSRVWIKQRNHACETLLERWAEPFTAWAEIVSPFTRDETVWTGHLTTPRLRQPSALIREAWRLLLQCQPHDSICGCSVDAVHDEMPSRFDQVQQIGEEITRQSLAVLADSVDTAAGAPDGARAALVVFNPDPQPRTDQVLAAFELPAGLDSFEIIDAQGRRIPYRLLDRRSRPLADLNLDADGLRGMSVMVEGGFALGLAIQDLAVVRHADHTLIDVSMAEEGTPNLPAVERGLAEAFRIIEDRRDEPFHLVVHLATQVRLEALVSDVPGQGLRTLYLRRAAQPPSAIVEDDGRSIENETLRAEIADDGTLTLSDRRTGAVFTGLLRLRDVADRGDSYTFCPVEGDRPIEAPSAPPSVRRLRDDLDRALEVEAAFDLPHSLTPDRTARSARRVQLPFSIRMSLAPGVPRLDVTLALDNRAEDHRLQLLFPLAFPVDEAAYDGAFEVVRRPTHIPAGGEDWIEQPAPEVPMRDFVLAGDGQRGLLIATRGLREASVSPDGTIAVTLLRAFGWLSRDDLATRGGGAGPQLPTPGGQELGPHTFHLSLIPFGADPGPAIEQALAFQTPLCAAGTPLHPGKLPGETSFLRWQCEGMLLSAVKLAEDSQDVILRGVNLSDRALDLRLETRLPLVGAWVARLDETPLEPLPVEGPGRLRLRARPHEIVTLRLRFAVPTV
ncbi:MAG: glycoside hydrolase family 38 C-terminal domain-containing protein [Chloroflexota bacterium]